MCRAGRARIDHAPRMRNTPPYRVVQWTTGNVGKSSVQAIAANPGLELVGCYAWSPDKVGRDVGELCGIEPLGVAATNDVDALLALEPDCVVYTPMWMDVDELVRILSSGVNVVATAAFITGHNLGPGRDRIVEACQQRRFDHVRIWHQPRLRRAARHRGCGCVRPGRQGHRQRGGGHHVLRLTRHRASGGLRRADRPPRPADDDGTRHRCLRRGRPTGRRRARCRARRCALRRRVCANDR